MTAPKKLMMNMIALLAVLLFLLSIVASAAGYILIYDRNEFVRSPQMAVIFTAGLLVLGVILVSTIMLLKHDNRSIRLFTGSATVGIFLSWLTIIVNSVVYHTEGAFGLFISLSILFLPFYIQIYLINFRDDVIQWVDSGAS